VIPTPAAGQNEEGLKWPGHKELTNVRDHSRNLSKAFQTRKPWRTTRVSDSRWQRGRDCNHSGLTTHTIETQTHSGCSLHPISGENAMGYFSRYCHEKQGLVRKNSRQAVTDMASCHN
jgi:hypothetical protein